MNFASDNTVGTSQAILKAVVAANEGESPAYGKDPWSAKAAGLVREAFDRDCTCFLVNTGTAANALALAAICPPFGAIFCHTESHITEDECGAPEMFTGGAKLIGISGHSGKIAPAELKAVIAQYPLRQCHRWPESHSGRNELEGRHRCFVLRRHQEWCSRLRSRYIL
jgi:threonine aldolase